MRIREVRDLMRRRKQAGSFMLPIFVLGVIPLVILVLTEDFFIGWNVGFIENILLLASGSFFIIVGLALLVYCIRLFSQIGKGTLAPWAPPPKLVIVGIYRRTRSPMILGVLVALFGESIVLSSGWVFFCFVLFWILNHVYFIFSEEPGLQKRFGREFEIYKENVPRWIPLRTPWNPEESSEAL